MTPDETQYIDHLTAHMTTRCIGRYLIDLPEAFVLNSQADTEIEGVKIKVTPMNEIKFENLFHQQQKSLENTRLPIHGYPYLRATLPLPDSTEGGVFDHAKSSASSGRASRVLELWAWRNGFQIIASIEAFDGTYPENADDDYYREQGNDTPSH